VDPAFEHEAQRKRSRRIATGLSLSAGSAIMLLKFYAFYLTGSSAVLSDALESIINVVASAFALISVVIGARPPDRTHPYGHGKIEYFSAGFEGALIIIAALGIFKLGILRILEPEPITGLDLGLAVLMAAGAANLALGWGLVKSGRKSSSIAVIADGRHILADVYSTAAVIAGLVAVRVTEMLWIDGAVACLVGIYISFSGTALVRKSFSALMDASDERLLERISDLIERKRKDVWIDIHQLRAWRAGDIVHIDLHLILPRDLTLEEAHAEAKGLEESLVERFDGRASVLIHTDPCTDPDCPVCRKYACGIRSQEYRGRTLWNKDTLVLKAGEEKDIQDLDSNSKEGAPP
jgi:cation diffusion facilitator family transporter